MLTFAPSQLDLDSVSLLFFLWPTTKMSSKKSYGVYRIDIVPHHPFSRTTENPTQACDSEKKKGIVRCYHFRPTNFVHTNLPIYF